MNILKTTLMAIATVLVMTAPAMAVSLDNYLDSSWFSEHLTVVTSLEDGSLWNLTSVYEEAGHNNQFWLSTGSTWVLDNQTLGESVSHVSLDGAYFSDSGYNKTYGLWEVLPDGIGGVQVFKVTQEFTAEGYVFAVNDLLIGFNDYYSGDKDYEDLVIRASSATPIPGAIWLLGSGLVGLVGLRRKIA